ncbi:MULTISPECIES: fructose-1-phosphate/6-phosphogluconate phosphatase [unclassified Tatumella]|uniref:fructose-1-phosphate/6-phosphogluconate phosphatase n=1 Tax=unclassified Tatumella TaxID=2649542 RepID=UPI001BAF47DC|nr:MULTISPECIES: fructose-1-phosphate/6-phosphogluconate phosphatase [unclassified Tatumella]MBS0856844.1 fructose-1-phosphate/6-phosphogluconate phosphatase [Tatumella sp. JGM16]MBS0894849.1 fructose-1-phosphate/6-phosphogluconate phosphatase [Tatumella sp. JGM130]MBS0913588.1 fructose-1-phosphate/6-phosphogluconate phosphatase [Tatumella sp. JGM91]
MYDHYHGLIFDMDGTLVNSEPAHRQAWKQVLAQHCLAFSFEQMIALNGSPGWKIAEQILIANNATLDPRQLAAEKDQQLDKILLTTSALLPLIGVARHYYGRLPMAVGTGSNHQMADRLLTHLGVRHLFNVLIAADDVEHHKPDPQTFLECARQMGVEAAQCVVFEDADFGIQAAKAAGMDFVDVRLL